MIKPDDMSAPALHDKPMGNPANRLAYLIRYGYHHLVGLEPDDALFLDEKSAIFRVMLQAFQTKFVHKQGRESDGVVGPVTEREMQLPRCGHPDHYPFGQAGVRKWGDECKNELVVRAALDGIKGMDVSEAEEIWYGVWDVNVATCDVGFVRGDDTRLAHSWAEMQSLPSGVLAQQYYPTSCGS